MAFKSGKVAAVYMKTTDVSTSTTGEAMSRVGSTMWWKVGSSSKQNWDIANTVTIYDGVTVVTPLEINYTGGMVLLGDVPTGAVTGDFYYFVTEQLLGCQDFDLKISVKDEESGSFGDAASKPEPLVQSWSLTSSRNQVWTNSYLETAFAGADNDIYMEAKVSGTPGNLLSFETKGGVSQTLSVYVENGTDIIVQLGTDGGSAVTSTTNQVIAAMIASDAVMYLLREVRLKTGDSGAGTPAVMAHTHLAGAVNPGLYTRMVNGEQLNVIAYEDVTPGSLIRFEGIGILTNVDVNAGWDKLTKEPITIKGYGKIYYDIT